MREFRLSLLTVVSTFFLLIVGGLVHGTGSSLACPDWPTCYGTFFPEMKGGIFFEHSHRIVASLVGLLAIVQAVVIARARRGEGVVKLGFIAVGLVIFQGILGGITVIYQLPTFVSSAHLATSMIFFSLTILIAFKLAPAPEGFAPTPTGLEMPVAAVTVFAYLQIVLGAVVRHTHAGLACIDIPLCNGAIFPDDAPGILIVHMAHRLVGVLVALAVYALAALVWKRAGANRMIRNVGGIAAPVLVTLQVLLGFLSVHTSLQLHTVTAHLGGGALLLACLVSLWLLCRRYDVHAPATAGLPDGAAA